MLDIVLNLTCHCLHHGVWSLVVLLLLRGLLMHLRYGLRNCRLYEKNTCLGWLIDHIKQDFHIVFEDSALLNTVLGQENINSHFLSLLQELLFRLLEVAGELAWHQGLSH